MARVPRKIYLALGSNLGPREAMLASAIKHLSMVVDVQKISPIYETDPVPASNQPKFLNQVLAATTVDSPYELLDVTQHIQQRLGRTPDTVRNCPRLIDIDLLVFEGCTLTTERLTLPHPRMFERAFVLRPLFDIAPDFSLEKPAFSLAHWVAENPDRLGVQRYQPTGSG